MQHALLGLTAETSIHAGTGRSTGVIDLPIMREAHTNWPCIYGSAVKGALRALAQQQQATHLHEIFGPDTNNASEHAGALLVGDARLLLLPIRSLSSHFKWVTCPALLRRAANDARRLGIQDAVDGQDFTPGDEIAFVPQTTQGHLFLEEFSFKPEKKDLTHLIKWLSRFGSPDFEQQLQQQLAIISDDMFAHLASFATPVTPHIAIDNETKTVKSGALWYEESLPPETVLYISLAAHSSRNRQVQIDAAQVLARTLQLFPQERPYLQLGGNETVGMGWCRVQTIFCNAEGV